MVSRGGLVGEERVDNAGAAQVVWATKESASGRIAFQGVAMRAQKGRIKGWGANYSAMARAAETDVETSMEPRTITLLELASTHAGC